MGMALTITGLPPGAVTVSAAELRRNFGVWQERAFANPVVVIRHGKPRLVLSSAQEFFAGEPEPQAAKESGVLSAYAGIPDHSSEALLVMDRDLRVLTVNRVFEDLAGRHASNMVGRPGADLFAPGCEPVVAGHFRHALHTGMAVQFDMPSALVEGRHYAFSVFPHADGIAALIVNRTAEVALRDELEASRSLATSFALAVDLAHARLNLRGLVEDPSPQFIRLMGLDAATPAPPFIDMVAQSRRRQAAEALDRVLAGGPAVRLETALEGRESPLPTIAVMAPIWRGPAVKGATLVVQPHLHAQA
jgi:PAS domain-containing protein